MATKFTHCLNCGGTWFVIGDGLCEDCGVAKANAEHAAMLASDAALAERLAAQAITPAPWLQTIRENWKE